MTRPTLTSRRVEIVRHIVEARPKGIDSLDLARETAFPVDVIRGCLSTLCCAGFIARISMGQRHWLYVPAAVATEARQAAEVHRRELRRQSMVDRQAAIRADNRRPATEIGAEEDPYDTWERVPKRQLWLPVDAPLPFKVSAPRSVFDLARMTA